MKNIRILLLAALIFLLKPDTGMPHTRIYVKIAPPKPRHAAVLHVKKPHKHAVWIPGHWKWNGHRYVWVKGRWVRGRKGYVYVPGHWSRNHHGWYWVPGHWKRI